MARSRASAKQAGTRFETLIVNYLAEVMGDDGIERRARNGEHDRGDITGVKIDRNLRVVLECKDYGGKVEVGKWLNEAETERINDDAEVGIVIAKRRGTTAPDEQIVLMTMDALIVLLRLAQR
jgi:hypothetical protein